jgi:hypothetical protein
MTARVQTVLQPNPLPISQETLEDISSGISFGLSSGLSFVALLKSVEPNLNLNLVYCNGNAKAGLALIIK